MTAPTHVLEMRLGQLQTRARQLLTERRVPAGSLPTVGRAWFDQPEVAGFMHTLDQLGTELRRALRGIDDLERQRFDMEAALAAAPQGQRWREQSRIASLDDGLTRVYRKAARLAATLIELRGVGGSVSSADLALVIQHIGTEAGKSLDQALVRHTVQQVSSRPACVPAVSPSTAAGGFVQNLFVVIAMVAALARQRAPAVP